MRPPRWRLSRDPPGVGALQGGSSAARNGPGFAMEARPGAACRLESRRSRLRIKTRQEHERRGPQRDRRYSVLRITAGLKHGRRLEGNQRSRDHRQGQAAHLRRHLGRGREALLRAAPGLRSQADAPLDALARLDRFGRLAALTPLPALLFASATGFRPRPIAFARSERALA